MKNTEAFQKDLKLPFVFLYTPDGLLFMHILCVCHLDEQLTSLCACSVGFVLCQELLDMAGGLQWGSRHPCSASPCIPHPPFHSSPHLLVSALCPQCAAPGGPAVIETGSVKTNIQPFPLFFWCLGSLLFPLIFFMSGWAMSGLNWG